MPNSPYLNQATPPTEANLFPYSAAQPSKAIAANPFVKKGKATGSAKKDVRKLVRKAAEKAKKNKKSSTPDKLIKGRNPVSPLQPLDNRIPKSTGMVPLGYARDLKNLQRK